MKRAVNIKLRSSLEILWHVAAIILARDSHNVTTMCGLQLNNQLANTTVVFRLRVHLVLIFSFMSNYLIFGQFLSL